MPDASAPVGVSSKHREHDGDDDVRKIGEGAHVVDNAPDETRETVRIHPEKTRRHIHRRVDVEGCQDQAEAQAKPCDARGDCVGASNAHE